MANTMRFDKCQDLLYTCHRPQYKVRVEIKGSDPFIFGDNAYPGTKDDDMIFNLSRTLEFTAFVDALGLLLGGVDI